MKSKILLIILISIKSFSQTPQSYTSMYQGNILSLYKYTGTKTMILATSNSLNSTTMSNWVSAADNTYNFYYSCTGQNPICYTNTCINGKTTIAKVPTPGTNGNPNSIMAAFNGNTGVEIRDSNFDFAYSKLLNENKYDYLMFSGLAYNFWFYTDKLRYTSNYCVDYGYNLFMRFMAVENLGIDAEESGIPFSTKEIQIKNLLVPYMADSNLNWANTLGNDQGVSGRPASELFASFCFYLKENYGGINWVQNVWKKAALRPNANNTQDAVDNFIIASSQAANTNLVSLFQYWKWLPSASAINYLNSTLGAYEFKITKTDEFVIYPNPVKEVLYFENKLKELEIYSSSGKLARCYKMVDSIDLRDLQNDVYFLKAVTIQGQNIFRKVIKM